MSKRILLLDTNFSAKPIYDYLIKTGAEVFVMGGNTQDSLAKSVKNYVSIDYSDVSRVTNFINDLKIDFLVPGGNDFSYKICSDINENFNFYNIDPPETTEIINNKEKFRRLANKIGLNAPKIIETKNIHHSLPVIIKPVDAYSGHGITIVFDFDENKISQAIELAQKRSKSGKIIIEEYITGQLYSHSAFIVDGEIIYDFIVEEHCIVNEFAVDTSKVIINFNQVLLNKIRDDITRLAKELNLSDGLIHTQLICRDNDFRLIEITRRCPGDLYSRLIELSTGFPYAEFYAKPFLNIKNEKMEFHFQHKNVIRHTITTDQELSLSSLTFNSPVQKMQFIPMATTGDFILTSPFKRIGILFLFPDSLSYYNLLFERSLNKTLYTID